MGLLTDVVGLDLYLGHRGRKKAKKYHQQEMRAIAGKPQKKSSIELFFILLFVTVAVAIALAVALGAFLGDLVGNGIRFIRRRPVRWSLISAVWTKVK